MTEFLKKLQEIKNGFLCGKLINLNNPKEIVLAFYFLGQNESQMKNQLQYKHDMDILMGK